MNEEKGLSIMLSVFIVLLFIIGCLNHYATVKHYQSEIDFQRELYNSYVLEDEFKWDPVWSKLINSKIDDTLCFRKLTNQTYEYISH